jgi:hypothetical protein
MAYKVIASSKSELDTAKAIEYYKEIRIELAREFLKDLRATKNYLVKHPKKIQVRYANIRVAFLETFPYGIHFRLQDKTITIISILGTAENPKKWDE